MPTILLNKDKEYQPSAVEKQMLINSMLNNSPCRILLELNQSGLHAVIPASIAPSSVSPGNGNYYFTGVVSAGRDDWFVVLYIHVYNGDATTKMFACNTANLSYSTMTAIKTRAFDLSLFGYSNYVKWRFFYSSSIGAAPNRRYYIKTRYMKSDSTFESTYEYIADDNSDLTIQFTRQ